MGVAGLWKILQPAGEVRSLTDLAVQDGFLDNPDKKRGFRLGIDASIWFFHAEYGKEGENPVLRTLFFRCAKLTQTTFLPLFVFDGPKRPDFKRGKKVSKVANKLIPGMKRIVEAFGFECRTAPGEAEAELAYLNRIGIIDGILSDDVDNFLFGATTVIRNISNNLSGNKSNPILNKDGKDDKNHTRVYTSQRIMTHPSIQLSRGGLILIGLMSGGDYNTAGIPDCGTQTSHALARCGFGDSLYKAAETLSREELDDFIPSWREELIEELRTNSRGIIGRKLKALAGKVPSTFPDVDILLSYVKPITSQSMGRESNNLLLTWANEPDLGKLAAACEMFFEWGYKEAILKRFRTVVWPGVVLRILRRAVLDQDERARKVFVTPGTPRRKGRDEIVYGTPSKMIAQRFSSMTVNSPVKSYLSESDDENEDGNRLIVAIHSKRKSAYTDHLLEYRLEIAPKQLAELAESGIQGLRSPEGPDEWDDDEAGVDDGEGGKKNTGPIDPETHIRVWMPACMVDLVEPKMARDFVQKEQEKEEKKIRAAERKAARDAGLPLPPTARKTKSGEKPAAKSKGKKAVADDHAQDVFYAPPPTMSPPKASKTKESVLALFDPGHRVLFPEEEEESDDDVLPSLRMLSAKPVPSKPPFKATTRESTPSDGIRDLTKKKNTTNTSADLMAFFAAKRSTESNSNNVRITHSTTTLSSTYLHASSTASSKSIQPPSASTSSLQDPSSGSQPIRQSFSASDNDDGTWDEYDPTLWHQTVSASAFTYQSSTTSTQIPTRADTGPGSPSKRSARNSNTGWSSDESILTKVTKSPRKNLSQSSPRPANRESSPSPTHRANIKLSNLSSTKSETEEIRGKMKTAAVRPRPPIRVEDVIELSDSDDDLPARVMTSKSLPPLMAARAKANAVSTAKKLSGRTTKPKAPVAHREIIELSD